MSLFGKGLPPMPDFNGSLKEWSGELSEYFDSVTKYMSDVSASIERRKSVESVKDVTVESNNQLNVKFKRMYPDVVLPSYAVDGDAGLDLVAHSWGVMPNYVEYHTGLMVEIPRGYVGLIFPRSSISKMYPNLYLRNSVGVIDSGYRGEITCRFSKVGTDIYPDTNREQMYQIGDKIAQLIIIPYPTINCIEVDELSDSERSSNGYGSTGR